jgi:CDP-diacylglycerol--serine O-phosphatidyltransferase
LAELLVASPYNLQGSQTAGLFMPETDPINIQEHQERSNQKRAIRKGIYLVPSAFTIGNIMCGFYAVTASARGYQILNQPEVAALFFDSAAKAIGIAVLLDGLDGRIARLTGATSEFGVELDSIADVVSFGIAPAFLAYAWGYGNAAGLERLAWAVSFIFLICGALRLARFNVLARSPRFSIPGNTPKVDKRFFVGLPIPPAAGLIAAIVHYYPEPLRQIFTTASAWGLIFMVAVLSGLMVSTLRYTSFKDIGGGRNQPFVILPALSLIVAGIWFYSQAVLLFLAVAYVLHGPLMKIAGLMGRFRRGEASEAVSSGSSSDAVE